VLFRERHVRRLLFGNVPGSGRVSFDLRTPGILAVEGEEGIGWIRPDAIHDASWRCPVSASRLKIRLMQLE
jgi:hypothetical protein